MTDLTDAIQRGWATADADAPEPAVTYFRDLLAHHPRDRIDRAELQQYQRALRSYAADLTS